MKVLGIDIGTTTISLVVLDPEQKGSPGRTAACLSGGVVHRSDRTDARNPLCGSGGQMYQSFVYLAGWSG